MSGSIYKLTCKTTNKSYIGQTADLTKHNNKIYEYGPIKRFNAHISASKHKKNPLSIEIQTYGKDDFTIEILERSELEKLDELEAKWISELNTVVPNGLNAYRHGKNKFHESSTLQSYFIPLAIKCVISPIKEKGIYKKVYLKITLNDNTVRRIAFGPKNSTIKENYENAKKFCKDFNCPIIEENYTSEELDKRYKTKLNQYIENPATKIRITTAANLIAVYINSDKERLYKNQKKICFGGVTVSKQEAYKTAIIFVNLLNKEKTCIIDDIISQQQATALKDEMLPLEENSVNISNGL
jgi:hypothetical protein